MKTKVGTILDKAIVQKLKEQAAKESRSMNEIIYDALIHYFQNRQRKSEVRRTAVERLCSRPFRLTLPELNEIIEEDYFEQ
ncbi:MAG: hypothetical protein ACREOO_26280 [bacterium]